MYEDKTPQQHHLHLRGKGECVTTSSEQYYLIASTSLLTPKMGNARIRMKKIFIEFGTQKERPERKMAGGKFVTAGLTFDRTDIVRAIEGVPAPAEY